MNDKTNLTIDVTAEMNEHFIALYKQGLIIIEELQTQNKKLEEQLNNLLEQLNDCQHANTDESMNSLKLKEALEYLIKGVNELPPLTAIQGSLTEQCNHAKEVIKMVENSWGWNKKSKE